MTLYERLKERYEESPEEFPQHIRGETVDGMMTCLLHPQERTPGPHWKPRVQQTLEVFRR